MVALKLRTVTALSVVALCCSSAGAAPTSITMSHNFGRFVDSCGQFDLQVAFVREQIILHGPKTAEGSNLLRYTKADPQAFTASVGTDECSFVIRVERLAR